MRKAQTVLTGIIAISVLAFLIATSIVGYANSLYSVGGTLTGLTGSVVLQNNGQDDLILNDDGPFAFAA